MNEKHSLEKRREIFLELCKKYPKYKSQTIKEAINEFDCDVTKIDKHLMVKSTSTCSNDSLRQNSSESGKDRAFSFISTGNGNSRSNSPVPTNKLYQPSSELSKISAQKLNLQKLDDAYKRLEKHRDFLNRESLYFGQIIQRRKTETDFPNINEIESLDRNINKKYSMIPKSLSYANDLRQPAEMNNRFKGFHGIYNPENKKTKGSNGKPSDLNQYIIADQLNPNIFNSLKPIDLHFNNLKISDEKRYSAHYNPNSDLPQELIGHSPLRIGHQRQRSDPWILERTISWDCPHCETKNTSLRCSFCEFDSRSKF